MSDTHCDYCDTRSADLKPSEMAGTQGNLLCPECRRVCDSCGELGPTEDFHKDNTTCWHCIHYQNREPSWDYPMSLLEQEAQIRSERESWRWR